MARADIHIFGSVSGYSTIAASAGVRADETRELEQFQFGEISTSDAMSRLETQATMTSRMLASGRMAISRMLPAGVDDAGRPTIEVITLIVFCAFSITYLREPLRWNYLAGFGCIVAAVFFVFKKW
jgi:hypothetical protein